MKIGKAIKWIFLCTVCSLNAQNKYSADFSINTQPTESIKITDINFGVDFSKTFDSKYKINNELKFNSKTINYLNYDFSDALTAYNQLSDQFTFSYLKSEKTNFNLKIEPFIASENNLKLSDINWLGELNVDFILSSNKSLTIGASRNTFFGKPMLLPIFSYYYEYSKNLNLAIGFPETKMSFSNNARNIFSVKNSFNGSIYNLETSSKIWGLDSTKSSFSQLTTSLEYERNMDTNWYVNFKMGYDFDRKYLLLDDHYNTTFDFGMKSGYNLGLTIKYKY